jgi:alkanesulfonate monooxygenase SsuD/methylene tetrahydromethanopterin reductase-like flavin-dependent oxidoreductase (luciferase family)
MRSATIHLTSTNFGIQLPATDALRTGRFQVREMAVEAERLGFDSVWVGDHLAFNAPVLESVVAATAAASVTDRVQVGFGVLVGALRQPAWLGKQISSLQGLSGDRVQLGLGVGGEFPHEWIAAEVPMPERGQRTDALLNALPALLTGQPVTLGSPWNIDIPPLEPHGSLPPIWVGGRSDIALRRAARHAAGWLGTWVDEARVRSARDRLTGLLAPSDAPPRIGVQVLIDPEPDAAVARDNLRGFIDGIYRLPFDRIERYMCLGSTDEIAEQLCGLVLAGASTVIFMPGTPDPLRALDGLAEVRERVRQALQQSDKQGERPQESGADTDSMKPSGLMAGS